MPYFRQFQRQPIEMGVRKIHGEFVFATEKFCKKILGISDSSGLISKSEELLSDSCHINRQINLFCRRIHDAQVNSPAVYDTLLDNVRTDGCISLTTDLPVFDSAGNCIATRFLIRPVSTDNFNFLALDSFKKKFDNCGVFLKNVFPIKLSYKDEIILGLLLLDYSQQKIAEIFGCSRSAIAKHISEELCPKFEVVGHSANALLEKAIFLGYEQWLPPDILFKPQLIGQILNSLDA